jgi:zinc transport system substrate-binding protein
MSSSEQTSHNLPQTQAITVTTVTVSNSLLGAAVRELAGEALPVVALAEPGMCPGHFDLRPSQVQQIQHTRLLLRFDFQKSLDTVLARAGDPIPPIEVVNITGGLCEPASFVEACRQVAAPLVTAGLLSPATADQRLTETTRRMTELAAWAREQIVNAKANEIPIMASRHQEAFCRSLGLPVAGTFPTADSSTTKEINDAVAHGRDGQVRLIIANRPEGRQAADALADRFGAQVVVFDNFPDGQGLDSFDRLVRGNVERLVKALQP